MQEYIRFKNRSDAGQQLSITLRQYKGKKVIVYALPRGGVVTAYEIAKYLNAPLDLIITRKIGHPYFREYAIGAVAENGHHIYNEYETAKIDSQWLKKEVEKERTETKRRRRSYLGVRKPLLAKGKIAILVDDGVATGLTLQVAILELNHQHPQKLIVAVPVVPADIASTIRQKIDGLITLYEPEKYRGAVSSYYDEFYPVEDSQVIKLISLTKKA